LKIKVISAPKGAAFNEETPYLIYGSKSQLKFVFDDNGESYFLYELAFVKVSD